MAHSRSTSDLQTAWLLWSMYANSACAYNLGVIIVIQEYTGRTQVTKYQDVCYVCVLSDSLVLLNCLHVIVYNIGIPQSIKLMHA